MAAFAPIFATVMRPDGPERGGQPQARGDARGFTLIELLVVLLIVGLLAAIAIPVYQGAIAKAERMALAADVRELYSAFMRYHIDQGRFPADAGAGVLNVATLSPLTSSGYFSGAKALTDKLAGNQLLLYWAPDLNGPDADFIAIGRSASQPNVLVYAMHYEFPGLVSYDGVYFLRGGQFIRVDEKY